LVRIRIRHQIGHVENLLCSRPLPGLVSHHPGKHIMAAITGKSIFTALASILLFILLHSPKVVDATALTYKIDANEKGCFYAWVDKVGEKIAFYFAVRPLIPFPSLFPLSRETAQAHTNADADCRYNRAGRSILITKSRIHIRKLSLTARRNDRVISCLQPNNQENIPFVSRMTCLLLLRK